MTNVRSGARSPIAAVVHAAFLLGAVYDLGAALLFASPLALLLIFLPARFPAGRVGRGFAHLVLFGGLTGIVFLTRKDFSWMRGMLGAPSEADVPFSWSAVNYAPIVMVVIFGLLWIGWHASAKKWFTGPKHTIDLPEGVTSAEEIALEHQHDGFLTGEHQQHHPEDNA